MDFNTEKKGLFLSLSTITIIIMMIVTTLLWWFVSPRLHNINVILAEFSLTILRIFYLFMVVNIGLVLFISYSGRNLLIANFAIWAFIRIIFPLTYFWGNLLGIDRDKLRESYTHLNNSLIKAIKKKYHPKEILVLLPHCLQNIECKIRVAVNILLCEDCGKCTLGKLKKLSKKYKVPMQIATGGTLARRIIIKNRPKFIIAVACGRDMVEGLREVFPIPVYCVLNEQPEGPCVNTSVTVQKVEDILTGLLING